MPARKILVIDDEPDVHGMLRALFRERPLEIHSAMNGADGIREAVRLQPDTILLDLKMPGGMNGIEVAERLKEDTRTQGIPVILLTSCRSTEDKIAAFRAGADDYVTKPFDTGEIDVRITSWIKRRDLIEGKNREIHNLKGDKLELERLAAMDEMTGLWNFREFRRRLRDEWLRSERYGAPLSLVMFDLDNFKRFNDTFGHPAGDDALREFATRLVGGGRETDIVARYGGEEFAIILPHTDILMATRVAERIRAALGEFTFLIGDRPARMTVSAGVATYPTSGAVDSVDSLVEHADRALYRAKELGKNRVESAMDGGGDGIDRDHGRRYGSRTSSTITGKRPRD